MNDCGRWMIGVTVAAYLGWSVWRLWRNYLEWRSAANRRRIETQAQRWGMPV